MGVVEKLYRMGFIEHYSKTKNGYTIRFVMPESFDLKDFKDFFEDFGLDVVNVRIVRGIIGIQHVIMVLEGRQYAD